MKKKCKGQTTMEMAIVTIAIIAILFFVVDIALLSFNWLGLQFSAVEGARYGATSGAVFVSDIEDHTENFASIVGVQNTEATVTYPIADVISVEVTRQHNFFSLLQVLVQFPGAESFTMSAHAERTLELA